ncbi:CPBP family intramembrane glutamic endopeptidase [Bacillus toyonensis]|uniref:CPBP family intramembrane glutamic endopeptidase n=1 Tax=Bacillus toyonensis TaxID=155322 RepID=UPI00209ABD81|nr:CPBP family intramembrane glutamic endopeptidase [Bacillus toyonensis]
MKTNGIFQKIKWIVLVAGLTVLSSLFFSYIKELLSIGVGNAAATNQRIEVNPLHVLVPLLVAPIVEEWIFRKKLTNLFHKSLSRIEAILFANGVFAFAHFDWFFFPYFVNGCLYAWVYEKTKDLKVPMLAHILYNLFVFLATSFLVK